MSKKILRILSLMLSLLLLIALCPVQRSVAIQSTEDRILQQITDTYQTALSSSNRYSFRGSCGAFANWHTYLLGINTGFSAANGNQQYDLYAKLEYSTGGHRVQALPGTQYTMKEALNLLSENGTKNVFNVLVGFHRTNTTAGQKYGHVAYVHAILDGKVYYSESYSATINGKYYAEGSPIVLTIDQFCNYYAAWTTYEGIIHFGLKAYEEQCQFLPAYLYATVTRETTLYSSACTPDVDAHSRLMRQVHIGERLSVIGMYRNTQGEYWYQVEDAEIGYVPAADTEVESLRHDDVSVSGISAPTEQRQGNIFNIKGVITSTYSRVCAIRAQVFTITDDGLEHWMTTTDQVEENHYSLSYSVVSNKMAFRLLELGSYRYEMAVVVGNNYVADGLLHTQHTTLKLWCSDFRVVEQKGSTASVRFDTCGGSAELNAAEVELGSPIGELPSASRDGYVFRGWYTAAEGGVAVTGEQLVDKDMTLYAHWEKNTNTTGWYQENGKPYYVINGHRVEGFFQADGVTYYQKADGFLATGWMTLGESRYFFNANGSMVSGWFEIDRAYYYFGADGTATVGWAEIDGKTYYFAANCKMVTGKQTIAGTVYYFGEDGVLIIE